MDAQYRHRPVQRGRRRGAGIQGRHRQRWHRHLPLAVLSSRRSWRYPVRQSGRPRARRPVPPGPAGRSIHLWWRRPLWTHQRRSWRVGIHRPAGLCRKGKGRPQQQHHLGPHHPIARRRLSGQRTVRLRVVDGRHVGRHGALALLCQGRRPCRRQQRPAYPAGEHRQCPDRHGLVCRGRPGAHDRRPRHRRQRQPARVGRFNIRPDPVSIHRQSFRAW
ncbi:hypothetical protein D3C72_1050510 [compost metagenome]